MKLRRITKRDGREVPFDKTKISDAVARAQQAVGEGDPHFAAEVADVVEMALLRRYPGHKSGAEREALPGIEEIQDLVEQALIELGHASVAKAYILYRDRRARIRAALQVRGEEAPAAERASELDAPRRKGAPRVQVAGAIATWSKGRIVVALMNEADLPRATAEQVAARVEERVFDSGLKRISTALIRELVDNELVELGLSQALRRQRPVVVPRHDLRRLLADPEGDSVRARLAAGVAGREPLEASTASEALGAALLARYAVEDLLPERVAELHLAGELCFEDLGRAHLALTQAVPCELLLAHERGPQAAFEALEELTQIAQRCAYGVVVENAELLFQTLSRPARSAQSAPVSGRVARSGPRTPAGFAAFLVALAAAARATGRAIDLAFSAHAVPAAPPAQAGGTAQPGAGHATPRAGHLPAWLPRLCEELAELGAGGERPRLPRLFLEGEDLALLAREQAALRPALDRLLASGLVVPTWSVAGERFAAPGLTRGWREKSALSCAGACAINLVRAARRAGPWREDALLENVARSVEAALEGLAALEEVQRRERWLENAQRGLVRARASYVIVPVGLREALRLVADGEVRPEQAARLYSFLSEAVQRFARAKGLSVAVSPWFGERAALRFAALDREHFQVSQPLLFEAGESAGSAATPAYSTGLDLSAVGPGALAHGSALEAAEAALCAAQKSGALHPPQILRALAQSASDQRGSALAAWERLERTRSRLRSGAWALYALSGAAGPEADSTAPLGAGAPLGAAAQADLYTPDAHHAHPDDTDTDVAPALGATLREEV